MEDRSLYRRFYGLELAQHRLTLGETDLALCLPQGLYTEELATELTNIIMEQRSRLQAYIRDDPAYAASHRPYQPRPDAPPMVRLMAEASAGAGVGPMAAVAGALAAEAGRFLRRYTKEVIVENGGDIYLATTQPRIVGVYAGEGSPFTGKLALRIEAAAQPLGVCASSGMFGSSFSYGEADVAVILATDTLLADAVATATANLVHNPEDVQQAVEFARGIPGVLGALALKDTAMAASGQITLCDPNEVNA